MKTFQCYLYFYCQLTCSSSGGNGPQVGKYVHPVFIFSLDCKATDPVFGLWRWIN